ncbi:hypothetical protein Runsl_3376 [Runella slithyformis DSM 19594]|uniref:Uncharacterized protein n=1 Tax=Runella slithyformis (strain ATCC 29530 / DSM 19594 / LMG 11500 / NCIMB 11436 / LSU 4) TaxID=761193 RepID=A0A7U3ZM67_RUNSL|nr:hypothetical protein Runsl_3376 [Runella slithyformis DSM 19594]
MSLKHEIKLNGRFCAIANHSGYFAARVSLTQQVSGTLPSFLRMSPDKAQILKTLIQKE